MFCALLALYMLNCSIDTSDLHRYGAAENLRINHQESIAELVIEKVLGFENAIPEQDDSDGANNSTLKKVSNVDLFILPHYNFGFSRILPQFSSQNIGFSAVFSVQTYFEIHSPPPEV